MKDLVLMDHDGGVDDLLSLFLLLTMDEVELIGVTVTPADCYLEPALQSTYKLLHKVGHLTIPIGRGIHHGVHAFPNSWRAQPMVINALPMLINIPEISNPHHLPNAVDVLLTQLKTASQPVKILMTGPCSNLVLALKKDPTVRNKIKEIVWMGGAFRVGGNVQMHQHDGSAEWNVYWDPIHAQELLAMELPLVLIPLDVTNHVPVEMTFLQELANYSNYDYANFAGQLWALTINTIPSYHYTYYMWDVLATAYLALEDIFETEMVQATIAIHPPNAGQTMLDENGFWVKIATDVNKTVFYEYLFKQFKANFNPKE